MVPGTFWAIRMARCGGQGWPLPGTSRLRRIGKRRRIGLGPRLGDFFQDRPPAGMGDHGEVDFLGGEPGVGFEAFASAGHQGAVHRQAEAREGGPIEGLDAAVLRGFLHLLAELTLEGMRAVIFIAEDEGVWGEFCGACGGREGYEALAGAEGGFHFAAIGGGGQGRGRGADRSRSRREPERVGRLPKRRFSLAMKTGQGGRGGGIGGVIFSIEEGCGKRLANQRRRTGFAFRRLEAHKKLHA